MNKKLILVFLYILNLNIIYSLNLKFLWWNVQNFFDTTDDPVKDDKILTLEQYQIKLERIVDFIKKLNCDIITLGEIENIFILKQIAINSNYQYYYLIDGNDPRGIDVGIISKFPLNYKSNKDRLTPYEENQNYKFSRDCSHAILRLNGKNIHILTTHLKSKFNDKDDKSNKKRVAQVFGILDIIDEIYSDEKDPFIILNGDFNTERYSEPMNILEKSGLIIINYLYNEKDVWTTNFKNSKRDIDYFIINDILYKKIKIINFKSYRSKSLRKISDHFPLYFEFNINL